jgi:hypothetical protein
MKRTLVYSATAIAAFCALRFGATETKAAPASGSLAGSVKLEGQPPKRAPINMAKEPSCAAMHGPVLAEDVVTDAAGNLQNVVVYISAGLPDSDSAPPQEPAIITQNGCSYKPHVIALQANQKLRIVNGDQTSHNIHPLPESNREWNKSQPPGSPAFEESFAREEIGIPVKCNVHPWMRAYISVFRHPYFSVTSQAGAFTIKNLPPGNYTVSAWHEKLGTLNQKLVVAPGESKSVQFTFKVRATATDSASNSR